MGIFIAKQNCREAGCYNRIKMIDKCWEFHGNKEAEGKGRPSRGYIEMEMANCTFGSLIHAAK
jgi:hypothetical protein